MKKKIALFILILAIPIMYILLTNANSEKEEELKTEDPKIYKIGESIENDVMKIVVQKQELSTKWRGKENIKEWIDINLSEVPVKEDGTLENGYLYLYTEIEATNKTTKDQPRQRTEFQSTFDLLTEPQFREDDSNRVSTFSTPIGKDLFSPNVNFAPLDYGERKKIVIYSILKEDAIEGGKKYYGFIVLPSDLKEREDIPRFVEFEMPKVENE